MDIVAAVAVLPEKQFKSMRRENAGTRIKSADRRRLQIIPHDIAVPAVPISLTRMRNCSRPFGQAGVARRFAAKGNRMASPNQTPRARTLRLSPRMRLRLSRAASNMGFALAEFIVHGDGKMVALQPPTHIRSTDRSTGSTAIHDPLQGRVSALPDHLHPGQWQGASQRDQGNGAHRRWDPGPSRPARGPPQPRMSGSSRTEPGRGGSDFSPIPSSSAFDRARLRWLRQVCSKFYDARVGGAGGFVPADRKIGTWRP